MTTQQPPWSDEARDRVYAQCAEAVSQAGPARESLLLARLALLLFEQVGDEAACRRAIFDALQELPQPSLSALPAAEADAEEMAPGASQEKN